MLLPIADDGRLRPSRHTEHALDGHLGLNARASDYPYVPLFFFSFSDGGELEDDLGVELADEEAARNEAIRAARSIIADCAQAGRLPLSARVKVEDESGRTLFALTFKDTVRIE